MTNRSSLAAVPLLALLLAAAPACGERTEAPTVATIATGTVSAQRAAGAVRITNTTAAPIAYAVIEREAFTHMLASWGACPELARCTVPPGGSATVPYDAISMYRPGAREAVVVWWTVVDRGDGDARIEDPREIVVVL